MKNDINIENFIPNTRTLKFNPFTTLVTEPLKAISNMESFHTLGHVMGVGMFVVGPIVTASMATINLKNQCSDARDLEQNIQDTKDFITQEITNRKMVVNDLNTFNTTLQTQLQDLQRDIDRNEETEKTFRRGMLIMITLNILTFVVLVGTKIILNRIKKK